MAISADAYQFLKLIKQQLNNSGSVFDPPPVNIRGNIRDENNPENQVLGFFIAADVSSKTIQFDRYSRTLPPNFFATKAIIPFDCRSVRFGRNPPTLYPSDHWVWN